MMIIIVFKNNLPNLSVNDQLPLGDDDRKEMN